ncbi:TetR/AcrR family transcriptional regulator [Metabacillus sp. 113a]|uniref:TetR/AcrR family transcriptional regulator n=1 Tax=Metabacillus sp. 113a TaxID=3404706 RepID=UPI003CE89FD5
MDESVKMTPAAQRILETASALFYGRGIHAVGVETIASEAGVTKKTLYDRFGSKEQLIVAYLKKRDDLWTHHLNSYLNRIPDHEPVQKIMMIFEALESWLAKNSQRGCAFVNALAELTEPSHPGRTYIIEKKKQLKQLFIRYLDELGLTNAIQTGEKLFILHEGITVAYSMGLAPNGAAPAIETAKHIIASSS